MMLLCRSKAKILNILFVFFDGNVQVKSWMKKDEGDIRSVEAALMQKIRRTDRPGVSGLIEFV